MVPLGQSAEQLRLPRADWDLMQITLIQNRIRNLWVIRQMTFRIYLFDLGDKENSSQFKKFVGFDISEQMCFSLTFSHGNGNCYVFPGNSSKTVRKTKSFHFFPKRTGCGREMLCFDAVWNSIGIMLGQDIPNWDRLPSEGNLGLISKDNDIVLLVYLKANWYFYSLIYPIPFTMELDLAGSAGSFSKNQSKINRWNSTTLQI